MRTLALLLTFFFYIDNLARAPPSPIWILTKRKIQIGGQKMKNKKSYIVLKQPKRRKAKDNPYTIYKICFENEQIRYYLAFVDSDGIKQRIEINQELFRTFNEFELEDISFLHEIERHYERLEMTENELYKKALIYQEPIEEIALQNIDMDKLKQAIKLLPDIQRRRLTLYYFGSYTYEQIAIMDNCTRMAVKQSVDIAIKKLKKFFEN